MSSFYVRQCSQGEYVDVGEPNLFYVELQEAEAYTEIYRSADRVVFKVDCADSSTVTVRVKWSVYKRVAQSRGYRGMEICSHMAVVPQLHSRELHVVGSTYVEVSVRDYMVGVPLSYVWCEMQGHERSTVLQQVERFIEDMSEHTSPKFMSLQGKNLSTPDAVNYLNYRMLLSMIVKDLENGDCKLLDMGPFPCMPVLCHGALSMDHVIVSEGVVTGIVGWANCDFVPEVMDRMSYHFSRPVAEGESEWYSKLASMLLFSPPPPPVYTMSCAQYVYSLRLKNTPREYGYRLQAKLNEAFSMLVPSVRQSFMGFDPYTGILGDRGSHSSHENTSPVEAPSEEDCESFTDPESDSFTLLSQYHQEALEETQAQLNPFEYGVEEIQDSTSNRTSVTSGTSGVTSWSEGSTILNILDELSVI